MNPHPRCFTTSLDVDAFFDAGDVAVAHGEQAHAVFGVRREDETPVRTHAHGVRARRRRCGARGGADGRPPARRTLTRRTARLVQRTRAHARRRVDVDAKHQRVHRRAARRLHDDAQVLGRVRTAHGVRKRDANGRTAVESSRHGAHVRHRRVLRGRRRRAFARLRGGDEIVIIQPQTRPDAESQHPSRAFRHAIARIDALVRAHRHRRLLDPPAFPLRIRPARSRSRSPRPTPPASPARSSSSSSTVGIERPPPSCASTPSSPPSSPPAAKSSLCGIVGSSAAATAAAYSSPADNDRAFGTVASSSSNTYILHRARRRLSRRRRRRRSPPPPSRRSAPPSRHPPRTPLAVAARVPAPASLAARAIPSLVASGPVVGRRIASSVVRFNFEFKFVSSCRVAFRRVPSRRRRTSRSSGTRRSTSRASTSIARRGARAGISAARCAGVCGRRVQGVFSRRRVGK